MHGYPYAQHFRKSGGYYIVKYNYILWPFVVHYVCPCLELANTLIEASQDSCHSSIGLMFMSWCKGKIQGDLRSDLVDVEIFVSMYSPSPPKYGIHHYLSY